MTDLTVREAAVGDVPAIRRVAERSWRETYDEILEEETIDAALAAWYDPELTRQLVEREDVTYLVAEDGGAVAGYVSGSSADESDAAGEHREAVLGAIYVDPERWGDGIGTALLGAFEERRRDRGDDAIVVSVLSENDVGFSFYRARGFAVVDEGPVELFGEPTRETVFRTALD